MCRRQRRLQCDLQCSQETCLRTDLWYSACYFYLLTKQLCQTILAFVKAIANWSMALMGIIIFEPTRSDHDGDTAGHVSDDSDSEEAGDARALSLRRRPYQKLVWPVTLSGKIVGTASSRIIFSIDVLFSSSFVMHVKH